MQLRKQIFLSPRCLPEVQYLWLEMLLLWLFFSAHCYVPEETSHSGGVTHLGCKNPKVCWLDLCLHQPEVQLQGRVFWPEPSQAASSPGMIAMLDVLWELSHNVQIIVSGKHLRSCFSERFTLQIHWMCDKCAMYWLLGLQREVIAGGAMWNIMTKRGFQCHWAFFEEGYAAAMQLKEGEKMSTVIYLLIKLKCFKNLCKTSQSKIKMKSVYLGYKTILQSRGQSGILGKTPHSFVCRINLKEY